MRTWTELIAAVLLAVALPACSPDAKYAATNRTLPFASESRSYILYVPQTKLPQPALVLILHGRNGTAADLRHRTRSTFDKLADRDGFIVVYPDAPGGTWNSGHAYAKSQTDDVGYLSALIDSLSAEFNVDASRVYVTGFSNGASMTYRLACERPDKIAAIAPVGGGLAERLMRPCAIGSRRPIPLLVMHGTADPINRFDDGEREGNIQYWIRRNGCSTVATISQLPDTDPSDGTRTRIERYENCQAAADVALYAIEGCGHHWPGGNEPLRLRNNGRECNDFDAGVVIWDFFKKHPMPVTH
jgi:polyhydroxybutyrate depolymerase